MNITDKKQVRYYLQKISDDFYFGQKKKCPKKKNDKFLSVRKVYSLMLNFYVAPNLLVSFLEPALVETLLEKCKGLIFSSPCSNTMIFTGVGSV